MSIADIVIIALVAFFAVVGLLRGAKLSSVKLGAFVVAFLISFFTAKVVAEALVGVDGVRFFVLGSGFGTDAPWSLANWIYNGNIPDKMSEFARTEFYQPIIDIISQFEGYSAQFTPEQGFALYAAFLMFSAIIGVGLFIVIRFLLSIVVTIIKSFFERRKSGAERVIGFFVGAVRGFCWALAITVALSTFGGLAVYDKEQLANDPENAQPYFIEKVESEYENSVLATYVNKMAYGMRNTMFLPDVNMYGRLVDLTGLTVREEDKDQGGKLLGAKLELYIDFNNLNYENGTAYSTDLTTGELIEPTNKDEGLINVAAVANTGFDKTVKAVMDYNAAAAAKIKNGELNDIAETELKNYKDILYDGANSIYNLWIGDNGAAGNITVQLRNYSKDIADGGKLVSQDVVDEQNGKLRNAYDTLIAEFELLKERYSALKTVFGALNLEVPELVVIPDIAVE